MNNTYGFSIPITGNSFSANLIISSADSSSTPYIVAVYFENESYNLNGTLYGQQNQTYDLQVMGDTLNATSTAQYSPIDFYHNGSVNFSDIVYFVSAYIRFNQDGVLDPACDLNHDGKLDFTDIQLFVKAYIDYSSQMASST